MVQKENSISNLGNTNSNKEIFITNLEISVSNIVIFIYDLGIYLHNKIVFYANKEICVSIKGISTRKQENPTVKAQKNRPEKSGRFF